MWFWRQVEALRAEFPALAACLGEERFQALCRDYLRAHPSEHHDIGRLGHRAGRLPAAPPARRSDPTSATWRSWSGRAPRSSSRGGGGGAGAPRGAGGARTGGLLRARLRLSPALRLLGLAHPAHESWGRALRGEEPAPTGPAATELAVWRAGHEVFHAPLGEAEARGLGLALEGASLGQVCAAFSAEEDPAAAAFAALASWLDEGWVAGLEEGGER